MGSQQSNLSFGRVRKFRCDARGATAIEFALLAIPFLLLVFAILESAVSYTMEQLLANAVDEYSREIRTGQITASNTTPAQFKARICDSISALAPAGCPNLHIDVKTYANFASVPKKIEWVGGVPDTSKFSFAPGGSESINQIRAVYEWPIIADMMKKKLSNIGDDKILLYAGTTWQNEPY